MVHCDDGENTCLTWMSLHTTQIFCRNYKVNPFAFSSHLISGVNSVNMWQACAKKLSLKGSTLQVGDRGLNTQSFHCGCYEDVALFEIQFMCKRKRCWHTGGKVRCSEVGGPAVDKYRWTLAAKNVFSCFRDTHRCDSSCLAEKRSASSAMSWNNWWNMDCFTFTSKVQWNALKLMTNSLSLPQLIWRSSHTSPYQDDAFKLQHQHFF